MNTSTNMQTADKRNLLPCRAVARPLLAVVILALPWLNRVVTKHQGRVSNNLDSPVVKPVKQNHKTYERKNTYDLIKIKKKH